MTRHRSRWRATALLLAALATTAAAADDDDGAHAVVLLYHHVADDTPASTSVTPAVFEAHLDHLHRHGYQVIALSRLLAAVAGDTPLPPRAVVITFDDGYRSVLTEAAPRLAARGWPFAVFVATDYVDGGYGGYLGWDELRRLEAAGAEIGNHSRAHDHYPHRRADESSAAWRARVRADMTWAQQRLAEELSRPLAAIAYPYGEFTPAVGDIARDLGLVGFGQQSGAAAVQGDASSLPRFPMAAGYADLDELASKLRTRPFRVSVRSPRLPVLAPDAAAPTLELELAGAHARLDALSCFVTGQGPPTIRWLERSRGRVAVTAGAPLPVGRSKYTCTAPAADAVGGHYWYSHLWMKPPEGGGWYRD